MTVGAHELHRVAEAARDAGVFAELAAAFSNPDTTLPQALLAAMAPVWEDFTALLLNSGWTQLPASPRRLLTEEDFHLKYAVTLPELGIFGAGRRIYDKSDLAHDPVTDRTYIRSMGGITELVLPEDPGLEPDAYMDDPSVCPVASIAGARFDEASHMGALADPAKTFGGMEVVGDRLWVQYYEFYNVAGRDNPATFSVDLGLDPSTVEGPFRVGPVSQGNTYHANVAQQRVTRVDPYFARTYLPHLPDPDAVAGSFRRRPGKDAFGGRNGPALYLWDGTQHPIPGNDLGALHALWYPGTTWTPGTRFGEGAGFRQVEGEDMVNFAWVYGDDFSCLIYGWRKGRMSRAEALALENQHTTGHANGPNWYGPGPKCSPAKGWHGHPYTDTLYLYDPEDVALVVQGVKQPSEPQAYEEFEPEWMWSRGDDCKHARFGGMTYRPARRELWILDTRAYVPSGRSLAMPVLYCIGIA